MLSRALAQSRLWMETPNPRVTKPMISSPGSGEQHLANLMGQLSMPSTTTPSEECIRLSSTVTGRGSVACSLVYSSFSLGSMRESCSPP